MDHGPNPAAFGDCPTFATWDPHEGSPGKDIVASALLFELVDESLLYISSYIQSDAQRATPVQLFPRDFKQLQTKTGVYVILTQYSYKFTYNTHIKTPSKPPFGGLVSIDID